MQRDIDWQTIFNAAVQAVAEGRAKAMQAQLLRQLSLEQRQRQQGKKWSENVLALAALYFATNKFEIAKMLVKSSLTKAELQQGRHHLEVSRALCILGEVYLAGRQYNRIAPLVLHTTISLRKHSNSRQRASRLAADAQRASRPYPRLAPGGDSTVPIENAAAHTGEIEAELVGAENLRGEGFGRLPTG
jgi:hypothetical protein